MGLMISESISQYKGRYHSSRKLHSKRSFTPHGCAIFIWLHSESKITCRKCQKLKCLLQDERMKPEMTDEAQLKQRSKLKTYENVTCFIVLLGWSLAQVVVAPSG
jgi:hypothetical protein